MDVLKLSSNLWKSEDDSGAGGCKVLKVQSSMFVGRWAKWGICKAGGRGVDLVIWGMLNYIIT